MNTVKNIAKQRVQRLFLGALLTSGLSTRELLEMSRQLADDPTFLRDFSFLLQDVLHVLSPTSMAKKGQFDSYIHAFEAPERAYEIIKKRRLSKLRVLSIMQTVTPNIEEISPELSMRQIVEKFFSQASVQATEHFLALLGAPTKEDPYLRGITKRI